MSEGEAESRTNAVSFDAFTPARTASPPALDGLPMPPLPLPCELPTVRLPTLPDPRLVLRPSKLDFAHGALCVRTLREEERQRGVERFDLLRARWHGCSGRRYRGDGAGDTSRRGHVVCKGRFIQIEVKLRIEVKVAD